MSIKSQNYTEAGVDIDAADEMIRRIGPFANSTRVPGATAGLGGFGGIFDLAAAGYGPGAPRLVSGTDGVGTKLKIAFAMEKHDTIGIDCVAMCVNDILTVGAKPLFFLDHFATGKLAPGVGAAVVGGVAEGCRQAECWLMGGETAELPGMYAAGEYDLAGFVVGAVTAETELHAEATRAGDVVIAIASAGLHSNGFSLARRVLLERANLRLDDVLPGDCLRLGERLLIPTRIYARLLAHLRAQGVPARAYAHITGGGLWENPQRSIAPNLSVRFDISALRQLRQNVFSAISSLGEIPETEMYRVFNMGVGLTMVVPPESVDLALRELVAFGESARVVGELVPATSSDRVEIPGVSSEPITQT